LKADHQPSTKQSRSEPPIADRRKAAMVVFIRGALLPVLIPMVIMNSLFNQFASIV
jgi:hypothetical protein